MTPLRAPLNDLRQRAYNVGIASKIIVPFIGLALLLSIAGGYGTALWTTKIMDDAAAQTLTAATLATAHAFKDYDDKVRVFARSLADTDKLGEAITAGQVDSFRPILLTGSNHFGLDYFEVLDAGGSVILENNGPYAKGTALQSHPLVQATALTDNRPTAMVKYPTGYALSSIAIITNHGQPAGYIITGFLVNSKLLTKIKPDSLSQVAVFNHTELVAASSTGPSHQLCSSSGCHDVGFGSSLADIVSVASVRPISTRMDGHTFLIRHDDLPVFGSTAAHLVVMMPMDGVVATQTTIRVTIFLSAALLMVLVTLLGFFISRGIARPVRELSIIARKVARGDLTPRAIYPGTDDEIGELASSFNKMTESLQRYTANLRKRLLELSVLYESAMSSRSIYNLEELLDVLLQNAAKAINADCGSLLLYDDAAGRYVVRGVYKIPDTLKNNVCLDRLTGNPTWMTGRHTNSDQEAGTLAKICLLVNARAGDEALLVTPDNADPATREKLLKTGTVALMSVPMVIGGKVIGLLNLARNGDSRPFTEEDKTFLVTLTNQAAVSLNNQQLIANLRESYISTVRALAEAIDAKDHYTQGHSTRVARYSVAIARELGLPEEDIEGIETASYLHDVGKIGISNEILMKPGKLSPIEMDMVRNHPLIGAKILSPIKFPWEIVPIVIQHHERYSGGGYPNQLAYDDIHIGARVLIVADSYEAMISERPYRAALSQDKAIAELRAGAGTQFDPKVVKAFVDVLEAGFDDKTEAEDPAV